MEPEGTCSHPGCNRPIWWGITEGDKRMPVDPPARADGRVVRRVMPDGKIRLHVLTGAEMPWQGPISETEGPFMPHHVTCPNADAFRAAGRRPPRRRRVGHGLTCRVCHGVLNARVTAAEGTSTHPCCDGTDGVPAAVLAELGYTTSRTAPAAARQGALDIGDDLDP